MGPDPLSLVTFTALLDIEIGRIAGPALRGWAHATLVPPWPKHLIGERDPHDVHESWVFAESADQAVGAVYCDRGPVFRDAQWGLVRLRSETFGHGTPWFGSVAALCRVWSQS